jgi:hypothetical protein
MGNCWFRGSLIVNRVSSNAKPGKSTVLPALSFRQMDYLLSLKVLKSDAKFVQIRIATKRTSNTVNLVHI